MEIDLIKYKKLTLSVSDELIPTNLSDVHTVHENFNWKLSPNAGTDWIKVNFYELMDIRKIKFAWSGTIDDAVIEYSADNINWNDLTASFAPDNAKGEFEYDYATNENNMHVSFLRITVTNPSAFEMTELELRSEIVFSNYRFISHNIYNMYSQAELNDFLPSITKSLLEMFEGKEKKNLTLFDPTDYSAGSLTKSVITDTLSIQGTSIPIDANLYIWDFDDGADQYIQTQNPLTQVSHTYATPDVYYPRLILIYDNYQMDYHTKITTV